MIVYPTSRKAQETCPNKLLWVLHCDIVNPKPFELMKQLKNKDPKILGLSVLIWYEKEVY
jgi:hypothetical protein